MFGGMGGQGGGMGGGIGGGRIRGPMRQAFRQQYPGDHQGARTAMQGYTSSQPFQAWMGTRPQRPATGWTDPQARQTAFSGWYNQMPNYPWGAEPADWTAPQGQQTPSGGGGQQGGQGGAPFGGQWGNVLAQLQSNPKFNHSGIGQFVNGMGQLGGLFHGDGSQGQPNWLAMLQSRFGG